MSATSGRLLFVVIVAIFAVIAAYLLGQATQIGDRFQAPMIMLIAGPAFMLMMWLLVQRGRAVTLDIRNISWAAVFGDLLVLTTVFWLLAMAYSKYGHWVDDFWTSKPWFAISMAIGFAVGFAVHIRGGKSDSSSPELTVRLHDSATSWAHNIGVFSAVIAVLVFTIVPLFTVAGARTWAVAVIAVLAVGMGGLMIADAKRASLPASHPLHHNTQWFDGEMEWEHWRPRPQAANE